MEQMDRQQVGASPPAASKGGRAYAEQTPSELPPIPAPFAGHDRPTAPDRQDGFESDPELLWKSQPNPWESAGWKMAPLSGSGVSQRRGTVPTRPSNYIARALFIQTAVAAALFAIIYGLFHTDTPLSKKGQETVTAALTDQMNFESAAALYRKMFAGAPSFIPMFGGTDMDKTKLAEGEVALPIVKPLADGTVVSTFAETLSGVEIAGKPQEAVQATETGRVLLVTDDAKTGRTVVIQHADNRVTVYGRLGQSDVTANDWVEAGQTVGKLGDAGADKTSLLFFAVKEKGRYVNPADVVPLD